MVGKKKRELTGIVLNYFYAVGEAIVALIAWLSRNWKILQFTVSCPALLFLTYFWLVMKCVCYITILKNNHV